MKRIREAESVSETPLARGPVGGEQGSPRFNIDCGRCCSSPSTEKTSAGAALTEGVARQAGNQIVNPKCKGENQRREGKRSAGKTVPKLIAEQKKVRAVHESLKPVIAPHRQKGKVYHQAQPGVLVRVGPRR
jgi:hypothetical protein